MGVGQTVNVGSKKESGHDQKVTIANDQEVMIANDQKTMVVNNQTTWINEGDKETNILKGNQLITIYEGKQTIKVKKAISIGSDESIEFICGSSKFSMDCAGTITITGNLITIKGKEVDIN